MPSDNIRIRVRAVGLDQDIANQAKKGESKVRPLNLSLNEKGFAQPLGRITGQMGEFEKSMDAAVARVFAFGAAVGVINGVSQALKAMAQSAIEVQKALADVNVVMNMTAGQMSTFGNELFSIARDTTASFEDISQAAVEFARQGLGAEETLKRISDAMILSRLSGLGATESVSALTAGAVAKTRPTMEGAVRVCTSAQRRAAVVPTRPFNATSDYWTNPRQKSPRTF